MEVWLMAGEPGDCPMDVNAFLYLTLEDFVRESNAIENITEEPSREELKAYEDFLALYTISVADLKNFVRIVAGAPIRDRAGMDVTVGDHRPPRGGPVIPQNLKALISNLADGDYYDRTPAWIHEKYETLHPFLDGNGRSGRILWAWHKKKRGEDPFLFGFLRSFYYEELSAGRGR
jgi:hypothetical protein